MVGGSTQRLVKHILDSRQFGMRGLQHVQGNWDLLYLALTVKRLARLRTACTTTTPMAGESGLCSPALEPGPQLARPATARFTLSGSPVLHPTPILSVAQFCSMVSQAVEPSERQDVIPDHLITKPLQLREAGAGHRTGAKLEVAFTASSTQGILLQGVGLLVGADANRAKLHASVIPNLCSEREYQHTAFRMAS